MNTDTFGWIPIYDIKDQCGKCRFVIQGHRMASCEYGLKVFPAAHNCPRFKYDLDDAK